MLYAHIFDTFVVCISAFYVSILPIYFKICKFIYVFTTPIEIQNIFIKLLFYKKINYCKIWANQITIITIIYNKILFLISQRTFLTQKYELDLTFISFKFWFLNPLTVT